MKTFAFRHGIGAAVGTLGLLFAGGAQADEALAQSKGCLTCHQVERKSIGPAFREVAGRYRSDPGAAATLARKTREGGRGAWGDGVMPPNPHVSEAESARLVAWVLGLK